MKEKLTRNLTLKAISVVLAFVIWIAVVNVSNPEKKGTKTVSVQVMNEDVILNAGMTYEIEDNLSVSVSYTVRTRDEYKVTASDFKAYIDMEDLYDVTSSVPVHVEVVNNQDLFIGEPEAIPGVVHVVLDDFIRMEVGVAVSTVGDVEEGYYVSAAAVKPNSVTVRGPRNLISDIDYAQIDVNVEGANENVEGRELLKYYNSSGRQVDVSDSRITTTFKKIGYTVFVEKGKPEEPIPETTVAPPTKQAISSTAPHITITDEIPAGPGGMVPQDDAQESLPASEEGLASESDISSPSDSGTVVDIIPEETLPTSESESETWPPQESESVENTDITEGDDTAE